MRPGVGLSPQMPQKCAGTRIERDLGFRFGNFQVLAKNRAELIFLTGDARPKKMSDRGAEEKPPQLDGAIQTAQSQRLDRKPLRRQVVCGLLHRGACFFVRDS